jgi:hypothetical protein
MKEKNNNKNLLYAFLEEKGVLETGDNELIEDAKNQYWKNYRRQWKKDKRHDSKSYTILLNDDEARRVINEAKRYHTSPTQYIKETALTGKQIADPVAIGKLRELIYAYYNTLQTYIDKNFVSAHVGHKILEEITEIEKKTFALLMPPK